MFIGLMCFDVEKGKINTGVLIITKLVIKLVDKNNIVNKYTSFDFFHFFNFEADGQKSPIDIVNTKLIFFFGKIIYIATNNKTYNITKN